MTMTMVMNEKLLKSAGCENSAVGLTALLNACKSHGTVGWGTPVVF